jgi:hypothetical protein
MNVLNKSFHKKIVLLVLPFIFYSCGLFLSPFSPYSYSNMTDLKVLHTKFIESFTKGDNAEYNKEKIDDFYNTVDIKFREAIEYEKQVTNDKTRLNAFGILYDQFKADYKQLIDSGELFSKAFSDELLGEVEKNYDLAIKGELSRRNAPIN